MRMQRVRGGLSPGEERRFVVVAAVMGQRIPPEEEGRFVVVVVAPAMEQRIPPGYIVPEG